MFRREMDAVTFKFRTLIGCDNEDLIIDIKKTENKFGADTFFEVPKGEVKGAEEVLTEIAELLGVKVEVEISGSVRKEKSPSIPLC